MLAQVAADETRADVGGRAGTAGDEKVNRLAFVEVALAAWPLAGRYTKPFQYTFRNFRHGGAILRPTLPPASAAFLAHGIFTSLVRPTSQV